MGSKGLVHIDIPAECLNGAAAPMLLIPGFQREVLHGAAGAADGQSNQLRSGQIGQSAVLPDVDIVVFLPHGVVGKIHDPGALRGVGHTDHHIHLTVYQHLENVRPVSVDILILPAGVVGDLLQIFIGIARLIFLVAFPFCEVGAPDIAHPHHLGLLCPGGHGTDCAQQNQRAEQRRQDSFGNL